MTQEYEFKSNTSILLKKSSEIPFSPSIHGINYFCCLTFKDRNRFHHQIQIGSLNLNILSDSTVRAHQHFHEMLLSTHMSISSFSFPYMTHDTSIAFKLKQEISVHLQILALLRKAMTKHSTFVGLLKSSFVLQTTPVIFFGTSHDSIQI